jgi:hypothetical protein
MRSRSFVLFTKLSDQRNQMMHIIFAIFVVEKASPQGGCTIDFGCGDVCLATVHDIVGYSLV